MATVTRTVEIDGEEHEVEVDLEDEGLLTQDEFKARMSKEVKRRVEAAKREAREGRYTLDDLADDDELLGEFRTLHPELFATENGDGDGDEPKGYTEEELERRLEKLRKKEVEPLQSDLESYKSEAERLRVEKLDREVVEAAGELGVRRGLIPLVKRFYRDQMDYSSDHSEWFRRDGDGFEPSVDDDFDADYVTVLEDLKQRKRSGDYADWFTSSTREGAGYSGPEGGGAGGPSKKIQEMTDQEKVEFVEEHGLGAYQDLVHKSFSTG